MKVVQLSRATLTGIDNGYEFPATVKAVKDVDLKFEVSGRLVYENLIEGSEVKKGQVLAKIDPTPFQRKVDESRIRFEDAIRDLKRVEEVFAKQVASQRELDDAKSQYSITKLALENAQQDLSYCTITAPFDAVVGERYTENNSYIRAGDTLANLQDRSKLYFSFEVPERIMTANAGNRDLVATARIIGREEKDFDLYYVEHQTTPDPITQTYGVTFALEGETTTSFYQGSRATVTVMSKQTQQRVLLIPVNALVGDKASGFSAWLFNGENQTIHKTEIVVAKLLGDTAVISEGLSDGDKVVSAAVGQMREGLKVKEYKAEY